MKVLVFAHTPPPHHGQSYMVAQMLEHAGRVKSSETEELIFHHVNARLSNDLEDVGSWRIGKVGQLLRHIAQAWRIRRQHAPDALYYIPAPAKRSALYRDWLVLLLVAPFFKIRIFHWHASGLGQWVEESRHGLVRRCEAAITRQLYSGKELSVVLTECGRREVTIFSPRRTVVVANGIPDPCPDFDSVLLPQRLRRAQDRREGKAPLFQLLFLALATRSKGLFDAVEAVARFNANAGPDATTIRLTVAGAFSNREEEALFQERIGRDDLALPRHAGAGRAVIYTGFAGPAEKDRLLRAADALCFASYFPNEAQPVSIIEALAYGLPVLLSRWRGLPGMVSASLAHLTEPNDPGALTAALASLLTEERFAEYRACHLELYSLDAYSRGLREAFLSAAKNQMAA